MTVMDQDLADASEDLSHGADICMHRDDAATCLPCDWKPRFVSDQLLRTWTHTERAPLVRTRSVEYDFACSCEVLPSGDLWCCDVCITTADPLGQLVTDEGERVPFVNTLS